DALRFRLESELSGGAHYLRRMKQEIETRQEQLRPALTEAHRKLAQAQKDMQVARKRNSAGLIITTLIIAFFFGMANHPRHSEPIPAATPIVETTGSENSGSQPPPTSLGSDPVPETLTDQETIEAKKFYHEGERFLKKGQFARAVVAFRSAIIIDPKFY